VLLFQRVVSCHVLLVFLTPSTAAIAPDRGSGQSPGSLAGASCPAAAF